MKNSNKTKTSMIITGLVLACLQAVSNTAAAEYKGYWMDTVREYQASQPRDYQQPPVYQDYYQPPVAQQEPVYMPEPHFQENYAPAPVNQQVMSGQASYYAHKYHGRQTASGEIYNMYDMTAAHRDLPFGAMLRVTNLQNGSTVVVRVNDRGPFKPGRIVDVSLAAAEQLGLILNGTADVQVEVLG